ncbi:hypothetical protein VITU102760_04075 [Vibrio tubiashii]|uniref:Uncharacterized protein n=1 Tax=Vibrio tubiashii ATCC 19109 TaxID=1051646 RepID=F9T6D7_9VIBR|nr:hypothetical protein [Vibrio tubiashii]AIW16708.1 hypothetical protein IX91_21755 [Vibrio tubiashii ATCC 19109]EGU54600.1 hypothetical protein VITU9109_13621 [Vibrio tubiashii ATCC 19109]EIF02054.1 hypothetical protein VT1337_20022 [Vibrio tubiashii NCIMB 1337 = ATCC 19106]
MKAIHKVFLTPLLTFAICSTVLAAKSPEPTSRANQTEQYAMVIASGKMLSLTQWKVEVDFGQALEIGIKNKDLLRDEEGNTISFNSPMDALNYMNSQGWILVSSNSTDNRFTAVIKRKVVVNNSK